MKVIWLGQSGLLFVSGNKKIIVDPYLSNSMRKSGKKITRGMKLSKKFFRVKPDIIILTCDGDDHTDIETLCAYIHKAKTPITVLCVESAYRKLEDADIRGLYNPNVFADGSEWTLDNLHIEALDAQTNDLHAIGIKITDTSSGICYYYAGNTLYNKYVINSVGTPPDVAFIPISGTDGCMNVYDAMRFSEAIGAAITVPVHFGMFDGCDPKEFKRRNVLIPTIYKVLDFQTLECKKNPFRRSSGLNGKLDELKTNSGDEIKKETGDHKQSSVTIEAENSNMYPALVAVSAEKAEESKPESAERKSEQAVAQCDEPKVADATEVEAQGDEQKGDTVTKVEAQGDEQKDDTVTEVEAQGSHEAADNKSESELEEAPPDEVVNEEEDDFSDCDNLDGDDEDEEDELPEDEAEENAPNDDDDDYERVVPTVKIDDDCLEFDDDINEDTLSEKLDLYIKEIEKFERGDTVDFERIDGKK